MIHDLADRRCRIRRNLNEIHTGFSGRCQALFERDNAYLLAILGYEPDFGSLDLFVLPIYFLCGNIVSSKLLMLS
jgi:hypothetical protein